MGSDRCWEKSPEPDRHNSGLLRHAWAILFFILVALFPFATARAAGIRDLVIPADKNGPKIPAELWTPCAAPAAEIAVDSETWPVAIHAVKDCPITQKKLPLILISHGLFGDRFSHHDTAEFLADAGFAVVSLNHTEDSVLSYNDKSVSDISPFLTRPIDIKRVMDWLLLQPPTGLDIDKNRVGFFGFSRGGYTGLVLAGAVPDFHHPQFPCLEKIALCREMSDNDIPAHPPGYEPRIKAFVLADPLSFFADKSTLEAVKVPIQLWGSALGGMGVAPGDVEAMARKLPARPEFHRVPNSTHMSFIFPCTQAFAKTNPPSVCTDPPGFDRTAFHKDFNAEVLRFFRAQLGQGPQ
jgi:predicted dienelactone hydrolase